MKKLNRNQWIAVVAAIVVLALLMFEGSVRSFIESFTRNINTIPSTDMNSQNTANENPRTLASGLIIEDVVIGDGLEATPSSVVTVHYTGTLVNGTKFDSSLDRGTPFSFQLGVGYVIRGWDEGVAGMKVGGKRKLIIPPQLGYGSAAGHPLQNETLLFEVEVLDVKKPQ